MMNKANRVLLIGVDTSKITNNNIPGYDPAEIHRLSVIAKDNLVAAGYDAKWCYLDITDTRSPVEVLTAELMADQFDCILVGAGLRKRPDKLLLFESLINAVHQYAPNAKICFNEDVHDTEAAVNRMFSVN
ncbi:MAG: hypothetical protein ACKVUS_14535 [Saprospiraceae bacterium]